MSSENSASSDGYLLGQRVVALDVTLHEVGEVEVWRWLHGEGDRREVAGHFQSRERIYVREYSSEGIAGLHGRSCFLGRNEEYGGNTFLLCIEVQPSVKSSFPLNPSSFSGFTWNLSSMAMLPFSSVTVRVSFTSFIASCSFPLNTVSGSTECLSGHHHLLGELQGNAGANAALLFFSLCQTFLISLLVTLIDASIAQ